MPKYRSERSKITSKLNSLRRRGIHPRKNDIIKIIKDGELPVYRDSLGRVYGFIDENSYLVEDLLRSGEINNVTSFIMWVWLPTARYGPFAKRNKEENEGGVDQIQIGQDLIFPIEGEMVTLIPYNNGIDGNEEEYTDVVIITYPEDITRNGKTSSVLVEIV